MELIFEYLLVGVLAFAAYQFITLMVKVVRIHDALMEVETLPDEQQETVNLPEDWIFPLVLEYNDEAWYAWDVEGAFITQAPSKDQLLTDILNKYEIPPKRLSIKSEKRLSEEDKFSKT